MPADAFESLESQFGGGDSVQRPSYVLLFYQDTRDISTVGCTDITDARAGRMLLIFTCEQMSC